MFLQFTAQPECPGTIRTLVRERAHVHPLVLDQVVRLGETALAVGTLIRLITSMRSNVALEGKKIIKTRTPPPSELDLP